MATLRDYTAERILERLSDTERYPKEALAPYEEFRVGSKTYYFTPGGFSTVRSREQKRQEVSSVVTSPTKSGAIGLTIDNRRK